MHGLTGWCHHRFRSHARFPLLLSFWGLLAPEQVFVVPWQFSLVVLVTCQCEPREGPGNDHAVVSMYLPACRISASSPSLSPCCLGCYRMYSKPQYQDAQPDRADTALEQDRCVTQAGFGLSASLSLSLPLPLSPLGVSQCPLSLTSDAKLHDNVVLFTSEPQGQHVNAQLLRSRKESKQKRRSSCANSLHLQSSATHRRNFDLPHSSIIALVYVQKSC